MKLIILIPAYNEEKTISTVIKAIPQKIENVREIDTVVIDDGSKDKTKELAKKAGAKVISHSDNKGVGNAFITGVKVALDHGADIVVNIDADGQFNPKDIATLIKPIANEEADFVTCSRFKNPKLIPKMPTMKIWGNKQIARFISFLIQKRVYDVSCGFRAYSREALLHLNLFGKFTYTQESFLDLASKGMRIYEVPLKINKRKFGDSKVADNLIRYGYQTLKIIFRTMRDYKPLKFFGGIGLSLFGAGLGFDLFLLWNKLSTGQYSPYKTFGFIGVSLNAAGLLILILALLADMLDRIRLNQEKLLYYEKKREYEQRKENSHHNRD